jgi:hypothetical protein
VNIKSENIQHQARTESNSNSTAKDGFKTQQKRLDVQDLQENFVNKTQFDPTHEENARNGPRLRRFRVRFLWF